MKQFIKLLAKGFFKIIFRVEIINEENIPIEGKVIICSNHISGFDGAIHIAFTRRFAYIMAKHELWKWKIIGHLLEAFNAIDTNREKLDKEACKIALNVLEENYVLIVHPEGTRHGIEKKLSAKRGAAFFSCITGAPIVPAKFFCKDNKYRLFRKVTLAYGKPFTVTNSREGTNEIMTAIEQIELPEKQKVYRKRVNS